MVFRSLINAVAVKLTEIEAADQAHTPATDLEKGSLKTRLSGLESGVQQHVNTLKADTSLFEELKQQFARNVIRAYEAVLTYRNNNRQPS